MQRTRLNTLIEQTGARLDEFFGNPWRRVSLILISLFFGIFIGEAVSTTVGQEAEWDVIAAGLVVLFTEGVSRLVYGRNRRDQLERADRNSLFVDVLNVFKIGVAYSLYLEAFKLGS